MYNSRVATSHLRNSDRKNTGENSDRVDAINENGLKEFLFNRKFFIFTKPFYS